MNRTIRSSYLLTRSQGHAEDSGAVPSVLNFTTVPVDRGGPVSQNQDRCGATPLMATAVVGALTATSGTSLGEPSVPLTAAGNTHQRMKLTKDLNKQQQDQEHVSQDEVTEEVHLDAIHQPLLQETEQGQQHPKDHIELEKLRDSYELYKTMYQGTPLEFRPRIPKFRCSPQLFNLTAMVDELILRNIDELDGLVHCAAMSVGDSFMNNGRKLNPRTSDKSRRKAPQQKHLPTWIMKIEKKNQ
ncbi:hypothetical protein B566_EDAN017256 [Ephemera danica]|nr:hypothetical protein B566_EDAN017256 [Ephemera danica]